MLGPQASDWLSLCCSEPRATRTGLYLRHPWASISTTPGCCPLQSRPVFFRKLELFGTVVADAGGALHGSKSTWTPCAVCTTKAWRLRS